MNKRFFAIVFVLITALGAFVLPFVYSIYKALERM